MNEDQQHRTRIKICGITRTDDATAAARAGADAIGLVFTPRSKRFIQLEQARDIARATPPLISRVALFMDQSTAEVEAVLREIHVDLLQFHGQESPDFCAQFKRPFIKALAMGGIDDAAVTALLATWQEASGLLFDAHRPGESGGQGVVFDWSLIPRESPAPVILAGGLNAANVAAAVAQVRPYAVDVSSGVEIAPGIKDHALLQQFVEEVRRGDTG